MFKSTNTIDDARKAARRLLRIQRECGRPYCPVVIYLKYGWHLAAPQSSAFARDLDTADILEIVDAE